MIAVLALLFVAQPHQMPDPLAVDGALVVVWHDGVVSSAASDVAGNALAGTAAPLIIGEQITRPTRIDAAPDAHVRVLVAGDRLLALDGPGSWVVAPGHVDALDHGIVPSTAPRVEPLVGFHEGPSPTLEALSSQPLLGDLGLPPTLFITHPIVPVTRLDRPEIRWHWPYPGGRFDLVLEEVDGDGAVLIVIERWRNLVGRGHVLWAPLERGRLYRVRIAHRSASDDGSATPIADERTFHVLAPSEIAAVDGALASLDALQRGAARYRPELDVLRARLLESHGLWDEAEKVWTGLTLLHPGRDDLLHQALRLRAKSLARP